MATYDLVFNVAKGRVAELAKLSAAGSTLIAVPLQTTGIVSAAAMRDYHDLATLLAGATDEQTTMGRKTLTSVVVSEDDGNDWTTVDCDDILWAGATGNAVSAIAICYKPSAAADNAIIPLVCLDLVATPAGGDITYQVNAAGFYKAA